MKTILRSQDLSCPSCILRIENALDRIDGVARVDVRFSGRIEVEHDPERVPVDVLIGTIGAIGYDSKVSRF